MYLHIEYNTHQVSTYNRFHMQTHPNHPHKVPSDTSKTKHQCPLMIWSKIAFTQLQLTLFCKFLSKQIQLNGHLFKVFTWDLWGTSNARKSHWVIFSHCSSGMPPSSFETDKSRYDLYPNFSKSPAIDQEIKLIRATQEF